jgi:hypothetical protein
MTNKDKEYHNQAGWRKEWVKFANVHVIDVFVGHSGNFTSEERCGRGRKTKSEGGVRKRYGEQDKTIQDKNETRHVQ